MGGWRDLFDDAWDAYVAGHLRDAILLWRRAAGAARTIGDEVGWFKAMVWAADASYESGDPPAALALLLDARQQEPADAPVLEAWWARQKHFDIVRATHPERSRLDTLLADLRTYAAERPVPGGDLPFLEAEYLEAIGNWREALTRHEAAWQRYDGTGSVNCWFAKQAAALCLCLDHPNVCQDWIEALGRAGAHWLSPIAALFQTQCRIDLALSTANLHAELAALLRTLTDQTLAIQRDDAAAILREASVRIHLLDPGPKRRPAPAAEPTPGAVPSQPTDDPAHPLHPARAEMRRRYPDRHDVHLRFKARLLFLDYRLACLRFAAGLPPRDDKYHRHIDDLTEIRNRRRADKRNASATPPAAPPFPDLGTHLNKARAAADWAMAYARKLDGLLQCDWRQREVSARRERIEAIAAALGTPASAGPVAQRPRVRRL